MLLALMSNPSSAADIAFNAYIEIPLGGGSPIFALGAGPQTNSYSDIESDFSARPRMGLELRYAAEESPTFLINGVTLPQSLLVNAAGGGASDAAESKLDWRFIVGAALGVGLIVAIAASDDSSVSVCSGSNCPPEEKPPPEEPEPSEDSNEYRLQ